MIKIKKFSRKQEKETTFILEEERSRHQETSYRNNSCFDKIKKELLVLVSLI